MADPPHEQDDGVGEAVARLHRRLHAASDSGWEKLFVNVPRTHPPLANSPALSLPPRALLHAGSVTHHADLPLTKSVAALPRNRPHGLT